MKWIDLTLPTPEENLALDEALLDESEAGREGEVLRFWEPTSPFVVLGYSNRWLTETDATACEAGNIPILRRCSGGGTILQGTGCLNYAVILSVDDRPEIDTVTSTNRHVLEETASALAPLVGFIPEIRGHTDLTAGPLKFSGNSQRRRKHFTLMHGTLLLAFDLPLVGRYLQIPAIQPEYRAHRPHDAFLKNLDVAASDVKNALITQWEATAALTSYPKDRVKNLVAERYGTHAWNRKF